MRFQRRRETYAKADVPFELETALTKQGDIFHKTAPWQAYSIPTTSRHRPKSCIGQRRCRKNDQSPGNCVMYPLRNPMDFKKYSPGPGTSADAIAV